MELVLNIDLAPTILGLAGVTADWPVDGWDLRPLLKGQPTYWRPAFMYEYFREPIGPPTNIFAYRNPPIQNLSSTAQMKIGVSFYDLVEDPYEVRNLYRRQ